jgi:hypothetical protein
VCGGSNHSVGGDRGPAVSAEFLVGAVISSKLVRRRGRHQPSVDPRYGVPSSTRIVFPFTWRLTNNSFGLESSVDCLRRCTRPRQCHRRAVLGEGRKIRYGAIDQTTNGPD